MLTSFSVISLEKSETCLDGFILWRGLVSGIQFAINPIDRHFDVCNRGFQIPDQALYRRQGFLIVFGDG